ncbi:phasin family protein [Alkalilimnicola ehrlichii]|nr:phasin family protein [Alkalilimnicola ehrlichii]
MAEQTQTVREFNQQMDRMVLPAQRVGALMMNNIERMAQFQLNTMQAYSHIAFRQWRDALEIRDQQSLREFFGKQSECMREVGKKMAEDTEVLASIGQEFARQAQHVAEENVRTMTDMTHALERAAQQDAQRAAERSGSRRSANA